MASSAPIAPLPPQVVAQIRSSISITSLNGVIVELVKNSLDAEATKIEIRVFRDRGGCMVQDDGLGIAPSEFEPQGGLAKPHHTSKHAKSQRPTHGTDGCFLASLSALSLVKIASKHFKHHSQNSITLTGGVDASRHIPAWPEERIPGVTTYGTRVCVYNLFGNMPVRVKQRVIEASDASLNLKERQNLRKEVTALLLFWHKHVLVTIKGDSGNPIRISNLETNKRAWDTPLPLEQILQVLYEAGFLPSISPFIWKSVTGKTSSFQLEGGICLNPAPTKNIQFISFGIKPMLNDGRRNVLYEEVNRLFANSLFGVDDELPELDEREKSRRAADRRFKTDGYTTKELKSSGKGVDRWPIFAMRIDVRDRWSMKSPDDLFEDDKALASISNLIQQVVVGFLEQYNFMPRHIPQEEPSGKRDQDGNLVNAQEFQPQPRNITDDSPRQRGFLAPGPSAVSPSMQPSRSEIPNYTVDPSIPRTGSPFDVWSRVKSGRTINATAVPKPAFPAQVDSSPASKLHPNFPFLTTRPATPTTSSYFNPPQANRPPATHFHLPFPPSTRTPPHPITSSHFSPPQVDRPPAPHLHPPFPPHMRTPATPASSSHFAQPNSIVSKEGQVLRPPFLDVDRTSASRVGSLRPRMPAEIITGTHHSDKAQFLTFKEYSWHLRQKESNEAVPGPSRTPPRPPLPKPTHQLSALGIAPRQVITASTAPTFKAAPPRNDHIQPQNQPEKANNLASANAPAHAQRKDSATSTKSAPQTPPPPEDKIQPTSQPSVKNNLPDPNAPSWEDTYRRQLYTSPIKSKKDEVEKDETQKYTDSRGRESYINTRTGQTVMPPTDPKTGRIKSDSAGVRPLGDRLTRRLPGSMTNEIANGAEEREETKAMKPSRFVASVLETYQNTVFKPVKEPAIPTVANQSTEDQATHAVLHGHKHSCSELDIQKAFKSSSGVSGEIGRLSKEGLRKTKVVRQVDNKFILITIPEGERDILVLVDQHAADERIRIEALMAEYFTPPAPDVMFPRHGALTELLRPGVKVEVLQTPILFETTAGEAEALIAKQTWFAMWGVVVGVRAYRGRRAVVKALPPGIVERCRVEPKLVIDLVRKELYAELEKGGKSVAEDTTGGGAQEKSGDWLERIHNCPQGILDMLNSRACRSAIMFNDELNLEDCEQLVRKLGETKFPFICAHGRPSMVPLAEVEGLGGYEDEKEISFTPAERRK